MNIFIKKKNVLSKNQMRMLNGGTAPISGGTCGYWNGEDGIWCGLTKSQATSAQSRFGGYWCCDSCGENGGSASYC